MLIFDTCYKMRRVSTRDFTVCGFSKPYQEYPLTQLRLYMRDNDPKNDNSKNALFVAQQYVRSYARKVEVLGLSLKEWVNKRG